MWWSWRRRVEAAQAGAREAAALLESADRANRDADPLVKDLRRIHRENHIGPRIEAAFKLGSGGQS